jgi:hypothetical protein
VTRERWAALGFAAIVGYIGSILYLDRFVDLRGQLLLGLATAIVLVVACVPLSPVLRVQVALVVAVASCGEVVGSLIWGVYTYRLHNLPSFVPPGHGLVYLGGIALATAFAAHRRVLVWFALVSVLAWGVAGVTVLPRWDVSGALLALVLAVFLLRGRNPAIYAGVFVVVAWLELYGTALGTWRWAELAPGTDIAQGNPPSGIAAGYVVFDIVSLTLAPRLIMLTGWAKRQRSQAALAPPLPDPARSA